MNHYIVATVKPWNVMAFFERTVTMAGTWDIACSPGQLTISVAKHNPEYVFFPHWSWKVPRDIIEKHRCVCFHMTNLPYGRGGSPLQNLIVRGHKNTMLTAFRMTHEIDAGPIYLKKPLSLDGTAEETYNRAARLVYDMIEEIIQSDPIPEKQAGYVVTFARRMPEQSECPKGGTAEQLYDHIRMLDAHSYPPAFIKWGDWNIEFREAKIANGVVTAKATIHE